MLSRRTAVSQGARPPGGGHLDLPARPLLPFTLPLLVTLLLTSRAYWAEPCPVPVWDLPAALAPLGFLVSVTGLLWAGLTPRPAAVWWTVTGTLLSLLGNVHTFHPYHFTFLLLLLARVHLGLPGVQASLAAVYALAALGKLNPSYAALVPAFFTRGLPEAAQPLVFLGTLLAPLVELLLAFLLLTGRTRLAGFGMAALHAGILVCLARLGWAAVVWPWNVLLLGLGLGWARQPEAPPVRGRPLILTALLLLASLPHHLGFVDLPSALPLYTGNDRQLTVTLPDGQHLNESAAHLRSAGQLLSPLSGALRAYGQCLQRQGTITTFQVSPRWTWRGVR